MTRPVATLARYDPAPRVQPVDPAARGAIHEQVLAALGALTR